MNKSLLGALLLLGSMSCSNSQTATASKDAAPAQEATASVQPPLFSQDSAFSYLKRQCDFGPRVPNTKAHSQCLDYLKGEMGRLGAKVTLQNADLKAFDGTVLKSTNIICSYYPERTKRIVLFSHWDCRPFSDAEKSGKPNAPVLGANDAASGIAVLMEIGRHFKEQDPGLGVDMVFIDSEDYGAPHGQETDSDDDWCLGAQYWAAHTGYTAANKPYAGILLDMVGAANAQFDVDEVSRYYAEGLMSDFWSMASDMGFGAYFVRNGGAQIIDDHYYINKIAGIPTFDIIDYRIGEGFPEMWHTQHDDVAHIDKNTLGVVGRALMRYLYVKAAK